MITRKAVRTTSGVLAAIVMVGGLTMVSAPAVADSCVALCFDVTDYGADPSGGADSAVAIQDAIDAAIAAPDALTEVRVPAGTYRLDSGLKILNAEGVSVVGEGPALTKLRLDAVHDHVFQVEDSASVTIEGLSMDRPNATVPWTQLTVVDDGGYSPDDPNGYIDVSVDAGYPSPGSTVFDEVPEQTLGFPERPDGNLGFGFFQRGNPLNAQDATSWRQEIAPGIWRLSYYNTSWNRFFEGQRIALITAQHEDIALAFRRNKDVTVKDVTNHASGYMGIWSHGMENLTLDGYRAELSPGRMLTSTRDAVHLTGYNRGSLVIEDSYFERSGDDILNYAMISPGGLEVTDTTHIKVEPDTVRVGDDVEVYSSSGRTLLGTATVTAASNGEVTLSQPIAGMQDGDLFLNNDASFSEATITRNVFLNHRGRGLLPHGTSVDVSDNLFDSVPQALLVQTVASAVGEGPITRDVTFTGNTVRNVLDAPAIDIGGDEVATATSSSAVGYTISDNTFENMSRPMLQVDLARDITVSDNQVTIADNAVEPFDLVNLGGVVKRVDEVNISNLDVSADADSPLRSVVEIAGDVPQLSIAGITGEFAGATQFTNNRQLTFDYDGTSTSSPIGRPSPTVTHFWDFNSSTEGWTNGLNIGIAAADGKLTYTTHGPDASILSPTNLGLDADKNQYLKFGLANPTAGDYVDVYFTTASDPNWSGAKGVSIPVQPNNGGLVEYSVDLGANAAWTGEATAIRIDVPDQATGGSTGSIDYVLFSDSARPSYSTPRWDFENGLDGLSLYNISAQSISQGIFSYTSSANPIVITPGALGLTASDFRFIRLNMKNTSPGQWVNVYFTTAADTSAGENKRLGLGVRASSDRFDTYYLATSNRNWAGALNDLRVDLPASDGNPATSSIDSIVLIGDPALDGLRAYSAPTP